MLKASQTSTHDVQADAGKQPGPQSPAAHAPATLHQAAANSPFFSPRSITIRHDSMDESDASIGPAFSAANDSLEFLLGTSPVDAEGEDMHYPWNEGGVLDLLNTSFYDFDTSGLNTSFFDAEDSGQVANSFLPQLEGRFGASPNAGRQAQVSAPDAEPLPFNLPLSEDNPLDTSLPLYMSALAIEESAALLTGSVDTPAWQ